ncbi:MAG: tRNA (adenosine(37)-N6)-dimethylallyltransferase MiaA [Eubacterium sp.]|nr:tRNA (adenosine(37)-N6)-dimethylallyltransferase MiaA [Eubacterium sp.]
MNSIKNSSELSEQRACVILTGPTAVGKTALSVRLAKAINGAVISADSMQIYRRMNIGSAKITPQEMDGVPHYLIDCLDPDESFDVYQFQQLAKKAAEKILREGQIPILAGGTGFYIQAFLKDIDFSESEGASARRTRLEQESRELGAEAMHARLAAVDPESAASIHPNNRKRVIRALEFYYETGRPISAHNAEQQQKTPAWNYVYFVLTDDRETIYRRIEARVDQMIADGLEEEVRKLWQSGLTESHTSMKGLGYREWFPYFRGACSREEVIQKIKTDTRHFAKRQLTWFRREPDVIWTDKRTFGHDEDAVLAFLVQECRRRGICESC